PQSLLAVAKSLNDPLVFVYILQNGERVNQPAVTVMDRPNGYADPQRSTALAHETFIQVDLSQSPLDEGSPGRDTSLKIVRMYEIREGPTDKFFRVITEHLAHGRIDGAKPKIGTCHGLPERTLFEDAAESDLTLAQGRLGGLLFGHVDIDAAIA